VKDPSYWWRYPVETAPTEIERQLDITTFRSSGESLELIGFGRDRTAPSILISPGSGGHAYVFAELGYLMHARGYNAFIMPGHGGRTITELVERHEDALRHVAGACNERIGIFAEGLGGYVAFYVALAHGRVQSLVCQNAPAILTEPAWRDAILRGRGAARRRVILPVARLLVKVMPALKLPIASYLDFRALVDPREANRRIEQPIVAAYLRDPDFVRRYPLAAILSLLETPPPRPLAELAVPTMFLVPVRGIVPDYFRDLFERLPPIDKKLVEVDGGVFWMVSHPGEAAKLICDRFDDTLHETERSSRENHGR
jgi:alpha-beta hydrolase superfamily lysophospholipase